MVLHVGIYFHFWHGDSAHYLLLLIGVGLATAAAGYACFAVIALLNADRRRRVAPDRTPAPVSVLKPLCGAEPQLYENLRTFCTQAHPRYQLLCGVRDPSDEAIEVVRRLQAEFPDRDIQLVIDSRVYGVNLKVSNLINLLSHARYGWLVIADSDIAVQPSYLAQVTAPLADPGVGVVTCLYRGVLRGGLWSRFGVLFIDDWFAPSVRVSHLLGSTRFSFGATLALRRESLEAAGGLTALVDVLADDFWLGEFTRRLGLRTVLSETVVTTDVTDPSLSALWAHELRWLRTIRAAEPLGFAFSFITFTLPMLVIGAALARTQLCWIIAAIGALARWALYCLQRRRRPEAAPAYEPLLLPIRDVLSLAGWAVSHFGSRVHWRNHVLDAFADRPSSRSGDVLRPRTEPLMPRP